MFTRPFHPNRFLQSVCGTEPFVNYCQQRNIPFKQPWSGHLHKQDLHFWTSALAQLPRDEHARIELELAKVNEMAGADATAHLIEAAEGLDLPPSAVPVGAPLALWFLVRHPTLFHEVFLHHQIEEVACWRTASAPPGMDLTDLPGKEKSLAAGLESFFRLHEGTGQFCTVEAHRLKESVCFVAQVADRLRFLDTFTDAGKTSAVRLRPALPVLFVYFPAEGRALLKSHLRAFDRTTAFFGCFAETVLGAPLVCSPSVFDLDVLRRPFHPLPDAGDMEAIRVKALHLRYPERAGRRQIKLETHAGDAPSAIQDMLRSHVPPSAESDLRVCYAELQIRMRIEGGSKNYAIRLWRDRSNLSQTPLGDRFRSCLHRWGLAHAAQP